MALALANSWQNTLAGAGSPATATVSGFSAGDLCVVGLFGFDTGSGNTWNFADGSGNTYTKIAESAQDGTTYRSWAALGFSIITTPPTVVGGHFGGGARPDCSVFVGRVTGAAAASVSDGSPSGKTQTSATPTTSALTTTVANTILFVGVCHDGADTTLTSPSGFTLAQENESNSTQCFHVAYQIVSSTGTYTPQFTLGASRDCGLVIGAFKAAAGAAAFQPRNPGVNFQDPGVFCRKIGRVFVPRLLWTPREPQRKPALA